LRRYISRKRITATEGHLPFQEDFRSSPKANYAMAIFHDENENDKLDTNWLGIPKEPISAFSNAKLKTFFGPPFLLKNALLFE